MTVKELLITGWWSERYQRHVRPLWEIAMMLPLYLVYVPAKAFVEWMEGL